MKGVKRKLYTLSEYMSIAEEVKGLCMEEADFVCECEPMEIKGFNKDVIIQEDYYVDFSDISTQD